MTIVFVVIAVVIVFAIAAATVGTVVLPVRYGCLPEVSLLTLRCAE